MAPGPSTTATETMAVESDIRLRAAAAKSPKTKPVNKDIDLNGEGAWDMETHYKKVASVHNWRRISLAVAGNLWSAFVVARALADGSLSAWRVLVMIAVVFLITDLLSGTLHLTLDNPYFLDWPGLGTVAAGFQQHHNNPSIIYRMTLFTHVRTMATPCAPVFAIGSLVHGHDHPGWCATYVTLSFCLVYMQLGHRWAHMPKHMRGSVINALQKVSLALPPAAHVSHHKAPYDHTFCIMSGLLNPALNLIIQLPGLHSKNPIWFPIFLGVALGTICFVPVVCF